MSCSARTIFLELLFPVLKVLPRSKVKEFMKGKRTKTFDYKGSERNHPRASSKIRKVTEYDESEHPLTESSAHSMSSSEKLMKIKEWWFAEHPPLVSDVDSSESSLNFKGALVPWNYHGSPLRRAHEFTPLKAVAKLLTCEKNKEASQGNLKYPTDVFDCKRPYGVPFCVYNYTPPGYVAPEDVRSTKKTLFTRIRGWGAPLCPHDFVLMSRDEENPRK